MKTVNESVNELLDNHIEQAKTKLERYKKKLKDSEEVNALLEKQGNEPHDLDYITERVDFYTEQIEELESRKKEEG